MWECADAGREVEHHMLWSVLLIIQSALEMLELFGLHELMSWRTAFLRIRVGKVCRVFRVCVDARPVHCAQCTTARRSINFIFRTNFFFSLFRLNIFFSSSFLHSTLCHVDNYFQYT